MSEQSTSQKTTSNGHEIVNSRDVLDFNEFGDMVNEYGLGGSNPQERLDSLRAASDETIAFFLTDLNRRLQGSDDSLVHEEVMKIGETPTISPEDRHIVFSTMIDKIRNVPEDTNPARVGDALALTVLMLHPFKDGNGRTARTIGLMYRDYLDQDDAPETFQQVAESRDVARSRGGSIIWSYVPEVSKESQSDPVAVEKYLESILTDDNARYMSLGGEVIPLKVSERHDLAGAEI